MPFTTNGNPAYSLIIDTTQPYSVGTCCVRVGMECAMECGMTTIKYTHQLQGRHVNGAWQCGGWLKSQSEAEQALLQRREAYPQIEWRIVDATKPFPHLLPTPLY